MSVHIQDEGCGDWCCGHAGDCLAVGYDPPRSAVMLRKEEAGADKAGVPPNALRAPESFERVWVDASLREDCALHLWRPVSPSGCLFLFLL